MALVGSDHVIWSNPEVAASLFNWIRQTDSDTARAGLALREIFLSVTYDVARGYDDSVTVDDEP